MNNSLKIIAPLALAITLIIGIYVGRIMNAFEPHEVIINSFRENKIDAMVDLISRDYVDKVEEKQIIEQSIPLILDQLDPHSVYIPAQEMDEHTEPLEGNFDGIGVSFNLQNDTIMVISVISGGPSEKVGVRPGDRIITIDDSVYAGKKITSDDVVKRLKGQRGTTVKIGVQRRDVAELIPFSITRDKIPLYSIDVWYMITDSIGYIKIDRFARTTYDEFMEGVQEMKKQGMTKLLVDLRANGGGYLDAATRIADEFLDKEQLIVYTQGNARPRTDYKSKSGGACTDIKVAVLIDAWSASASEILAGALQDNDVGVIVGQRSFGKGLVQEPMFFADGSGVRLTVARYYTPTGRSIQKPYNKGHKNYEKDILDRIEHGEFVSQDSIKVNDTLKYTTPKGKVVYGGGGIMPDVFVPNDTSAYNDFYEHVTRRGWVYDFALEYADNNRKHLLTYLNTQDLYKYLQKQNLYNDFLRYVANKNYTPKPADVAQSKQQMEVYIQASVARNMFDNKGFYPVYNTIDKTVLRAIEELRK